MRQLARIVCSTLSCLLADRTFVSVWSCKFRLWRLWGYYKRTCAVSQKSHH